MFATATLYFHSVTKVGNYNEIRIDQPSITDVCDRNNILDIGRILHDTIELRLHPSVRR